MFKLYQKSIKDQMCFFCIYAKKYPLKATVFVENIFFVTGVMLVSIMIHVQQRNIQKCGITEFHCKSIKVKMRLKKARSIHVLYTA